ncbi:MAG: cysteine--1-D-myo-inosityl 2-amino-2-deoxy-alpha-D-glucopyranoside ligase [Actinomycetota bacterium]
MDRWPNVAVPALPTLDVVPRVGGVPLPRDLSLYVCGITPYDATHLGHAATYLAFDHLVRLLRAAGHRVRHVQNVTDVDDPLLERAAATETDWRELAASQIALFSSDMEALRMVPPDRYVGVVESIPLVVGAVERLLDVGSAYRLADIPDVYAAMEEDERFRRTLPVPEGDAVALFEERGGDPARPGKRAPLDPLLWRAERPGEPAWDGGALGRGRPGWHIECAAIAADHLGGAPTITGGGSDLAFPHHHMSASHLRELGHGEGLLTMHTGMVSLDGHKMSKSRGNLEFVARLMREGADPRAIRLVLAAHHWRTDWEWHPGELDDAARRLIRWRAAAAEVTPGASSTLAHELATVLADDVDTPAALTVVDDWAGRVLGGDLRARADAHALGSIDALLGIDLQDLPRRRR